MECRRRLLVRESLRRSGREYRADSYAKTLVKRLPQYHMYLCQRTMHIGPYLFQDVMILGPSSLEAFLILQELVVL